MLFCTSIGLEVNKFQLDSDGNGVIENGAVEGLVSRYGLKQEDVLIAATTCYDSNGKKQLSNGLGDSFPLDPKTECLLMVPTCDAVVSRAGVYILKRWPRRQMREPVGKRLGLMKDGKVGKARRV